MPPIGKKFNQFKQWTGEKFGNNEKTETSEEFKKLKNETEERKEHIEKINEALNNYIHSMSKRKDGILSTTAKTSILETLGCTMVSFGSSLPHGSGYGQALMRFGEIHEKIAHAQIDHTTFVKDGLSASLQEILKEAEEYSHLKKKLENRRLDFDAKINKLNKSKKEKPELEEESRVSQLKYEESLQDITNKMLYLTSIDDDQIAELIEMTESELNYHKKAASYLENLKAQLTAIPRNVEPMLREINAVKATTHSRKVSHSHDALDSGPRRGGLSRQASHESLQSVRSGSYAVSNTAATGTYSDASRSRHGSHAPIFEIEQNQVKALYDFNAEAPGELSLRQGDIMWIVEDIDENWCIGEMANGSGQRGMFPRSYVQIIQTPSISQSQPPRVNNDVAVPSGLRMVLPSSNMNASHSRGNSNPNFSSASVPTNSQRNLAGNFASAQRSNGNIPAMSNASVLSNGSAMSNGSQNNMALCSVCGCDNYSANVFKSGQCNNCFHKH